MKCCVFLSLLLGVAVARGQTTEKLQTIQAEIRTENWKGWGNGEPLPAELKKGRAPEKFTRIHAHPGLPQTFSGKVVGLAPTQKAQIGIVSMIGTQWLSNKNYEWFPLDASRAFSVVSVNHPEAGKTFLVKADASPWTFLRADFAPGEGASDIELHIKPAVKTAVTMEDAHGNTVGWFQAEIFNAYVMTDDNGKQLDAQRFGKGVSNGGVMLLDLPSEPVALLLEAGPKIAPYYMVIDPRQANHFHFKMLDSSRIKGTVTQDGKPAAQIEVYTVNDAAPLSASIRKTDAAGRFDLPGRTPGVDHLTVGSYQTDVQLKPGETADLKIDLSSQPAAN